MKRSISRRRSQQCTAAQIKIVNRLGGFNVVTCLISSGYLVWEEAGKAGVRLFSGFHDRFLAVDRTPILEPVTCVGYQGRCPPRAIGHHRPLEIRPGFPSLDRLG